MHIPPKLHANDSVAVIAPAGYVSEESLTNGINELKNWGLNVHLGSHIFEGEGFFSASDSRRLEDFQDALDDTSIKAIFIARGGFGLGRILDSLGFGAFVLNPKWIVGFSDITLLHFKLHALNVASIHGPMVKQFGTSVEDSCVERLRELMFSNGSVEYQIAANSNNLMGHAEGVIIGGNLTLIANNIGTSSDIDFSGKILFIEEVNEFFYAIDRHLNQLQRAGKFENLAGVIVGEFSDTKQTSPAYHINQYQLIKSYFVDGEYPVLFDFPAGHGALNMPFAISCRYQLTVNPAGGVVAFSL